MKEKPLLGGQAVLEGVMMKAPTAYATAVRTAKGKIVTQFVKIKQRPKWVKIPFLRGVITLIDMMVIGIKSLAWSANQAEEGEELSDIQVYLTLSVSLLISLGLFLALPYVLTVLLGFSEETSPILFNLVDGTIKAGILILYLWGISLMKDIYRVFQYHGAEHKTVFCYEAGKPLTVKNVQSFSRFHPRCGTSFILEVVLVGILVFSLLPSLVLAIWQSFSAFPFLLRKGILFAGRILFVPIIAGITYELMRASASRKNAFTQALIAPGLWMQRITTKEPDDSQAQVAIRAMECVLKKGKRI